MITPGVINTNCTSGGWCRKKSELTTIIAVISSE